MRKVVIIDGLNMFLRSYIINPTMDPKGNLIGGSVESLFVSIEGCSNSQM